MQAEPTRPVPNIYSISVWNCEVLIACAKGISPDFQEKSGHADVIQSIESDTDSRMILSLHFLAGYCAIFSAKTVI
jgi:hypothetical protein